MGTGKSVVGRELAKIKKWHFADLDELIELKEKMTIPDIFARKGEPSFRRIEKRVLKEVAQEKKFVVACGGGVVLDKHNIKLMNKTGLLVCLSARSKEILKRVSTDTHRPLLNVKNPLKRIELLLKMRAPYYMQADKIINTSNLSIKQVVRKISEISCFKKR
ncbi:MAG: shikimate kinase [Candidatus Omnitrophota bacterium]